MYYELLFPSSFISTKQQDEPDRVSGRWNEERCAYDGILSVMLCVVMQYVDSDFIIHFAGVKGVNKVSLMNYYLGVSESKHHY